ncbi:MAG: sugar-binding domain-containing protein [Proteocatella sp.]
MNNLLEVQRKIVPEALILLEKRYSILKEISLSGTIGRRMLATKMNISERIVRSEVDFLKTEGLLSIDATGMVITPLGAEVLDSLGDFVSQIRGLSVMQDTLAKKMGIYKVIIIPASVEYNQDALKELGKEAAKYFLNTVKPDSIVGITGGYTMYEFSEQIQKREFPDMMIVPARGGLGEILEIQSNNIVANLAGKLMANYKLLHIPDNIDKDIMGYMRNDPQIKNVVDDIEKIDYLVFGIGNAEDMAKRRRTPKEQWEYIKSRGAVAESFGHYFDINGQIVHETGTVGIELKQYEKLENIIGIAGGKNKAEAILSISKINKNLVLITDESAAYRMLDLLN